MFAVDFAVAAMRTADSMADKSYLLFPLLAAMLYSMGAVFLRRASRYGVGAVRTTVLANLVTAVAFSFFYPIGQFPLLPDPFWPCLAVGFAFALGQITTVLAFASGHVSVATPALGSKVVLVALLATFFFGNPLTGRLWVAAFLVFLAIFLLVDRGRPGAQVQARRGFSIAMALVSALAFAVFDVLVQEWSPRVGFGLLLPLSIWLATLFTLPLLKLGRAGLVAIPRPARGWLAGGIVLIVIQALLLIGTIGHFGNAPSVNIVYGSRGLWSVLAVLLLREMTGDGEEMHNPWILVRRLVGGGLMAVSVLLAMG